MNKRVFPILLGAAIMGLGTAIVPGASPSPSTSPSASGAASRVMPSPRPRAVPAGGWTLTLLGKRTVVLPIGKVPAKVSWDGTKAGNINPSLRYVYKGQTLYKLVGLVDDKDPKSFNVAAAEKGYTIQFVCLDGYSPTVSSKRIIGKKKWIIAKKKAGKLLPDGEGPFRFVGSFIKPFNGKLSAYEIVKIKLIF